MVGTGLEAMFVGLLLTGCASSRSLAERIAHSSEHDGPRRSEDGDTLIEVLLALVILGLASVALLTAFATSIVGLRRAPQPGDA